MKPCIFGTTLIVLVCAAPLHAATSASGHAAPLQLSGTAAGARSAGENDAAGGDESLESRSPSGISATFFSCSRKAGSDTIGVAACISDERVYQDARLNKTYKALLAALDAKGKSGLVAAEREWLSLKEKDEDLETLLYGDDQADNLQQGENEVFRICERANVLSKYLDIAKSK
jgi:uncharacterized protein YecT (DUF1311 family)